MSDRKNESIYEILEKQNEALARELDLQKEKNAKNTSRMARPNTLLTRYYRYLLCVVPVLLLLPYLDQLGLLKLVLDSGEELCEISVNQAEALLLGRGYVVNSLLYRPYQLISNYGYAAVGFTLFVFFAFNYMQQRSDRRFEIFKFKHINSTLDKIKITIFTLALLGITYFIVNDAKKQVSHYESMVKVMDKVVNAKYDADSIKDFPTFDTQLQGGCFSSSNIKINFDTKADETYVPARTSRDGNKLDLSTK